MKSKNFIAYLTLSRKEINRILRIWPQTLVPSMITQSLYFIIFGNFIGSRLGDIAGVSYVAFIVPGLVMMSIINNSYTNVSGSFFSSKFMGSIEELLVSPAPNWVIIAGYATAGIFRGILVGLLVFFISCLFTRPQIHNIIIVAIFVILTSAVFSLAGFLNGILAKKFDDISIFPTFILTPLTYLGGVFYSVKSLPAFWQSVSNFNPILYMINGFRFGLYGYSDVNIMMSLMIIIFFIIFQISLIVYILQKGYGLKS
ncbi:MAG: ABC transporter permease [Candidatus Omnitrophica bacterium]|nr:ABC transporter permease [Candidatus Omnitrophota bacterium]